MNRHYVMVGFVALVAAACSAGVDLSKLEHPFVACNAEELGRLRAAYQGEGPEKAVVASYVGQADARLGGPVVFPPRGGQHNQWYQCQSCQMGLRTVDDTHHKCPKCGTVYSGPPYDDVIFSHRHGANLRRALDAAWAYALTSEQKYARDAAEILLGYAERYRQYPYHSASLEALTSWGRRAGGHLYEQTLNEAVTMATQIAPAYDLVHDALTAREREAVRDGLLRPMLENIDKNKAGKSNWQSWHNAAMIAGGALLGEAAWVEKAIEDPDNGFRRQMDISVSQEGMWYENSWGYHFYTLHALVLTAERARYLGVDLWSDPRLRKMFLLPVQYTMADGSLPRFGDDVSSSVRRSSSLFEPAHRAWRDAAIGALLSGRPSFQSVQLGLEAEPAGRDVRLDSAVFAHTGHAILRMGGEAGLTAAMTFGPYGGSHGHFDKLSFVFFGHGRELGVDPGRAASQAYRLPIHAHWYKATLSHNTVLVDRKPQAPAEGQLLFFAANERCAAAAARCTAAYPGVEHRRVLVMLPEYLLVVDQLSADGERAFDWVYHSRGDEAVCDLRMEPVTLAGAFAGGEYIQDARTVVTGRTVRMAFEDKELTTRLTMAGSDATEVVIGTGPGASVTERVPMVMVSRRGRSVAYAAVLEPVKNGAGSAPADLAVERGDDGLTVTVRRADRADVVRIDADGKATVAREGGAPLLPN